MKTYIIEKRVAILSTMAVAAYCFMIVSSFAGGWDSMRLGYWMGRYDAADRALLDDDGPEIPGSIHYVSLKPKGGFRDFASEIRNDKDGSVLNARLSGVEITMPRNIDPPKEVVHLKFFDGLLFFILFIILLALPIRFIRLMLSVKREMIFSRKNVNRIRSIGIMLILIYFIQIFHVHLNFRINQILFNIPDYMISRASITATLLVVGTAVLVIAEIISKGLEIKTDQELTI